MELSIIIVNYKTPKLTKKCVESIKKFPPKFSYEVIVIDNSTDNVGFAMGNNKGIRKAKGKYILLLNSDTEVKKNSLDKLIRFAKKRSDAGAVAPRLLNEDGSVQPSCFNFPTIISSSEKYAPQNTQVVDIAVMAAFLITPKCLKKVGLLDEKYFMYFEDFDYCRRIKKFGLKVYYLVDSEVTHIHGASGGVNKSLIESAKKYYGVVGYYTQTFILWLAQKCQKLLKL